ncbi:hypothetical protein NDK50_35020 [Paraburkholderia bryophila]|uniref:hypothetical protein n=1 Tax=Paraburkholderia bryophila TaxID=420952 RepID=UPI0023494F37|nr:hypothetical protein [Paraburkholderia bryophila]WCM23165.1 hypothetical protein NDK50_35020 [Paraburkholderia bryophila]
MEDNNTGIQNGARKKVTVRIDSDLARMVKLYCDLNGESMEDRVSEMFRALCREMEENRTVTTWFAEVHKRKNWRRGDKDRGHVVGNEISVPLRQNDEDNGHGQ